MAGGIRSMSLDGTYLTSVLRRTAALRQRRSIVYRTLCNVDLRDQPALVGLTLRKIERSEFSSLPIGRIAKRITQTIGESLQFGGRPPTLRVCHIDKLLLRSHSDVDDLQAASLYFGAHNKHGQKGDAQPSERRVTHHVAVVHEQRCSAAHDRCSVRS